MLVLATLLFAPLVVANIVVSDNTNVAVPATNGTSSNVNITALAQQYVGFYGSVAVDVRKNTSTGYMLFNKTATGGKLYFYDQGVTVDQNVLAAPANTETSGNFSLTGSAYNVSQYFTLSQTVCGVASTNSLNTSDGYLVGIFRNQTGFGANYFLCVDISNKTSTNGFGTVQYEIVVPKTATYIAYDVYYDLG